MTRLKSNSAVSWTRARPGPTTDVTINSIWSRSRRSNAAWRSSALPPDAGVAGRAVGEQASRLVDDRHALGLEPVDGGSDEVADRPHLLGLELPRTFSTIEADGSTLSRENSGRSGSTRCTRAISTR